MGWGRGLPHLDLEKLSERRGFSVKIFLQNSQPTVVMQSAEVPLTYSTGPQGSPKIHGRENCFINGAVMNGFRLSTLLMLANGPTDYT